MSSSSSAWPNGASIGPGLKRLLADVEAGKWIASSFTSTIAYHVPYRTSWSSWRSWTGITVRSSPWRSLSIPGHRRDGSWSKSCSTSPSSIEMIAERTLDKMRAAGRKGIQPRLSGFARSSSRPRSWTTRFSGLPCFPGCWQTPHGVGLPLGSSHDLSQRCNLGALHHCHPRPSCWRGPVSAYWPASEPGLPSSRLGLLAARRFVFGCGTSGTDAFCADSVRGVHSRLWPSSLRQEETSMQIFSNQGGAGYTPTCDWANWRATGRPYIYPTKRLRGVSSEPFGERDRRLHENRRNGAGRGWAKGPAQKAAVPSFMPDKMLCNKSNFPNPAAYLTETVTSAKVQQHWNPRPPSPDQSLATTCKT